MSRVRVLSTTGSTGVRLPVPLALLDHRQLAHHRLPDPAGFGERRDGGEPIAEGTLQA
jgi:hypothetical protein